MNINEIRQEFLSLDFNAKVDFLRKYSKVIIYNEQYQNDFVKSNFVLTLLDDIYKTEFKSNDDKLLYLRLFCLFLSNLLINQKESQYLIFDSIFTDENNFDKLNAILKNFLGDLKLQKFLLSIIYNLFFLNSKNCQNLKTNHLSFFIEVIKLLKFEKANETNEKDSAEINDWIHVIFGFLLKDSNCVDKVEFLLSLRSDLINQHTYQIFLELFRDVIEYTKETNTFLIHENTLKLFIQIFNENIQKLKNFIDNFSKAEFADFERLTFTNFEEIIEKIQIFKEFICLVDLLSVIIIIDDYRSFTQNLLTENFLDECYEILKTTDKFYDEILKRGKSLNENPKAVFNKQNTKEIEENHLLFTFQTNVLKFLSNYSLKNNKLKEKIISNPGIFYYLLNHLKMDKYNPFKKEWTVLLIKSLSEDNYKIQTFIENLKPVEIDPLLKDYLQKNNYNFNFEVGTHKVKVNKNLEIDND
jgi:hypothetical protein